MSWGCFRVIRSSGSFRGRSREGIKASIVEVEFFVFNSLVRCGWSVTITPGDLAGLRISGAGRTSEEEWRDARLGGLVGEGCKGRLKVWQVLASTTEVRPCHLFFWRIVYRPVVFQRSYSCFLPRLVWRIEIGMRLLCDGVVGAGVICLLLSRSIAVQYLGDRP